VSDGLVSLVHRRAQGNPFFTEELLKAFVEKGAVAAGEGHVGSERIAEVEVPRSIRSVIGARLGRLPQQSQELLRLASLLGPEFDLEVLLTATGDTETEVLDALDAALEAGIIGEIRSNRERFAFAHVLIQQTLYEEMPVHRRRRLHLRVGQALEQPPIARSTLSADKARHFLLGGDAERAARYAIEAGDHAALRYAHAEAANQYQLALDLLLDEADHAARAAEVQYKLGAELYDLNRLSEALAMYEASLCREVGLGGECGTCGETKKEALWSNPRSLLGRNPNFTATYKSELPGKRTSLLLRRGLELRSQLTGHATRLTQPGFGCSRTKCWILCVRAERCDRLGIRSKQYHSGAALLQHP
jgi:predicted ATPase